MPGSRSPRPVRRDDVNRPDGRQVEYDGHPLYLYAGDSTLRQIEGSGKGTDGAWFAVSPDLKPVG